MSTTSTRLARVLGPFFEGLAATPVLVVLWTLDLAGRSPLWVLLGSVGVGMVTANEHVQRRFGGPALDRLVHLRLATHVSFTAVILFVTGWGPVLAPAFVIVLGLHLKWGAPARTWRPLLAWSLLAIICGQLAIAAGWVYSYIPSPRAHGLAVLSALILVLVMRLLGVAHEDRERQEVERRRAEEALRDSERRFRALVHNATDMIVVADAQGIPTYVSPSSERITGHTAESMLGMDPRRLFHPDDTPSVDTALAKAQLEPGGESRLELRYRHADGSWHWHEAVIRNLMDEPAVRGLVINHRDVTERHELEEQLRHQAFHDPLTGLANRALFMDRLEHALARQQRHDSSLAIMLIDLDDFKSINDSLGHLTGDRLIVEAAGSLQTCLRPEDTVARLGGDEFAVLLEEVPGPTELRASAERVLAALKRTYTLGEHDLPVTASVGVTMTADKDSTAEDFLRNADVAMYVAKGSGKGRITVYEPGMHLAVHERLQVKADLAHALTAGDQLTLDYQPIIELTTGRPVGVEALVRWDHPRRGRVMPDDFIPVAEESGLILPLGRWVLTEACRQIGAWRRDNPALRDLSVSVNISGTQLEDPGLVDDVRSALTAGGLEPSALVLEITETVLVRETDVVENAVRKLKRLGVKIALDDFGTGCSSLRYLQRFPLDVIKIDRCFITDLSDDPSQALIADTIIRLGNGLGLATVAEGIEETDDATALRDLDCPYGQGYLFARPGKPHDIKELLLRSPTATMATVPRPRSAGSDTNTPNTRSPLPASN